MGQGESRPGGGASSRGGGASVGLHVLRVAEGSPAASAGIEPFFDHIVGFNELPLDPDTESFIQAVESAERARRPLRLQVWSSKREELRQVTLQPSRDWSQSTNSVVTHEDAQPSLLGLSLRLCSPEGALEHVWHILDILEGSPAQAAGLVSYGDYIIGYAGGVLRGEGDFYRLVEQYTEKPLRLFVYNSDFDVTREVVIVPNRDWGNGDSLLGCGVGYGLLHRIPRPQDRPAAPPELAEGSPDLKPTGAASEATARPQAHADIQEEEEDGDDDDYLASQGVSLVDTSAGSTPKAGGGLYGLGAQRSGMLRGVQE